MSRTVVKTKYELKQKLGKGGFGDVYLGVDRGTGRMVAIKILSVANQPKAMVDAEVSAMRRAGRHPNIVGLLDVVWVKPDHHNQQGEAWLVMELAGGGGLFERLVEEGAYSERQAASVLQQVALAIYHLHSRGILHRDIKPENVVFGDADADAAVRLIDFGTAVVLEEQGAKIKGGGRIGTWSYWAPEQLVQEPYDFAVDMWSLGILMYILLVGYHPFDPEGEASEQEVLANMKAGRIEFDSPEWQGVSDQVIPPSHAIFTHSHKAHTLAPRPAPAHAARVPPYCMCLGPTQQAPALYHPRHIEVAGEGAREANVV